MEAADEARVVPNIVHFSYAVTARGIYFGTLQPTGGGTIELLDPATGRHSILARTDKTLNYGVTISPDGRYLLFAQSDYRGANLMMIENFR